MPPETPDTLAPPDIAQTVDRLMPRLRAAQRRGWLIVLASVAATALLGYLMLDWPLDGEFDLGAFVVVVFPALLGGWGGQVYVRRAHEAELMQVVAGELGLTFRRGDPDQIMTFPMRLLPRGVDPRFDAMISGKVGGRDIRFAEIRFTTRGRQSRTILDGMVLELVNIVALPTFLIVPKSETQSGLLSGARHEVSRLAFLRDVSTGKRQTYGLWLTDPAQAQNPAFEPVIAAILKAETDLGPEVSLYSAMSDGETTWLTFRKTRDLFRVGGLFISRASVLKEVQHAAQDFGLPLRLITRLLEIEATAARASLSP
jgi:hypothetical protein